MAIQIKPLFHYITKSSICFSTPPFQNRLLFQSISTTSPSHHEYLNPLCNLFRDMSSSRRSSLISEKRRIFTEFNPREIENYFKIMIKIWGTKWPLCAGEIILIRTIYTHQKSEKSTTPRYIQCRRGGDGEDDGSAEGEETAAEVRRGRRWRRRWRKGDESAETKAVQRGSAVFEE